MKNKKKMGARRGNSLLSLEPDHFSKGHTFVFITMRIQYIISYLRSKSKNH